MADFFIAFLLRGAYGHSRRTLFRTLLKKSVKQILIPELVFIGDVLDDSALHQSVSIDHSLTAVRGKAHFN